jgi:glycosyltransferase involved in cell wall biosynthesis
MVELLNKTAPLVSVIIPAYNRANILPRAINSVLNQTYQDFEIIIVDDNSTDDTEDIVKKISDGRIQYIKNQKNVGAAVARNVGIESSKGKYIAFLDSDDEWLPEKLSKQIRLFENSSSNVGVVYSGLTIIDNGRPVSVRKPQKRGDLRKDIVLENWVGPLSTGVVSQECFINCGLFDESLPACQDWDLWIQIAQKYEYDYIAEPLVNYHLSSDSITQNTAAKACGHTMLLKKYYKIIKKDRKAHSNQRFNIGHYNLLCGEHVQGQKNLFDAVRLNPLNIEHVVYLTLSLFGGTKYKLIISIISKIKSLANNKFLYKSLRYK